MARTGRPPKPTRLKILTGNPGCRPLNGAEPKPKGPPPKCPAWLDKDGKSKWKALSGELGRLGLLTVVDGDALAAYCQAWAEFKDATLTLQKEGRTVDTATGGIKAHPAVQRQRQAMTAIRQFASLFGLDPSSRSKLHVSGGEEQDPLDEFIQEKQA